MQQAGDAEKLHRLASEPVGRLLWRYSLPAVVGMVVNSLYNVIDRVFIGQGVGPDAIAGLTITFPVMNLSTAIGVLIGAGASARVSILLGAGDKLRAEHVLGNALVLTLINCSVYLTLFGVFLDDILRAFGASDATLPYAHDFMTYILPGMLMMNLMFTFNNIMRSSGYPMRAMVTMFIGAGLNVILAPLFIFGLGWGIKGAAIATDIAMTVSMLFVMAHFVRPSTTLRFRRGIYGLSWPVFVSIIGIGAAPSIVNACASVINVLINRRLYAFGGDSAVAAAGIFTTYTSLLVMVIVGICQGMQPIVGYNYGAGYIHRLKRTFWITVAAASVVCCSGAAFGLTFPHWIARAFTVDAGLIGSTVTAMTLSLLCFWFVGFQIVATNFFMSIGQSFKSIVLSLMRQVIFLIPLLLTLPGHYGLRGVWASFPLSDLMATVVTVLMIGWQFRHLDRLPGR